LFSFFFTPPAPTDIYTLSLHDALPILLPRGIPWFGWTFDPHWGTLRPLLGYGGWVAVSNVVSPLLVYLERFLLASLEVHEQRARSEEHTSELQSRGHLVCRLLLEKKKK